MTIEDIEFEREIPWNRKNEFIENSTSGESELLLSIDQIGTSSSMEILNEIHPKISSFFEELIDIKEQIDSLKKEIREIKKGTLILKSFKPSKEQLIAMEKYRKYTEWLQEKEHEYQDQIIAILEDEKKENWEIIAHADSEKELEKKLDEYFKMNRDTSDKYLIFHNFGETTEFFKY
jgi:hypothetical protein